jgi:hypothetical protein
MSPKSKMRFKREAKTPKPSRFLSTSEQPAPSAIKEVGAATGTGDTASKRKIIGKKISQFRIG